MKITLHGPVPVLMDLLLHDARVPVFASITMTIEWQLPSDPPPVPRPPPNEDAKDAARYRYMRANPEFYREQGLLRWYLPRYIGAPLGEPAKTLAQRLDEAIDAELRERDAALKDASAREPSTNDEGSEEE